MPLEPGKVYEGQGKRGQGKFTNLKVDFLNVWREGGMDKLKEVAYKSDKNFMWFTGIISKMLPSNLTFGQDESNEIILSMKKVIDNMNDK